MMALVDTPIWSLALRRRAADLAEDERRLTRSLRDLIQEGRVQLLGAIRQEVLSGIREEAQFRRIRAELRAFEDVTLATDDYEEAATMSNQCRRSGVATSAIDMLICAASRRRGWQVLTTDRDFIHYQRVLSIQVLSVS